MILLYAILALYVCWFLYVGLMNLSRVEKAGTMTREQKWLALPWLAVGYVLDALLNVFVFTVLFLELPRELLMTSRLSRLKRGVDGWRKRLATWFCVQLLDSLDPSGCHCKES